jgi:hypothetical protein
MMRVRMNRVLIAGVMSVMTSLGAGIAVGYAATAGPPEVADVPTTCKGCVGDSFCSDFIGDGSDCLRACAPFCRCLNRGRPKPECTR